MTAGDGVAEWWCRRRGQEVQLAGGDGAPSEMHRAVPAATRCERDAPDGHTANGEAAEEEMRGRLRAAGRESGLGPGGVAAASEGTA